jgi:hypothetical protein
MKRLLGKKFKVVDPSNPDHGKVFTIQHAEVGYVFYTDQLGNDYQGKYHHIQYRIENGIWLKA